MFSLPIDSLVYGNDLRREKMTAVAEKLFSYHIQKFTGSFSFFTCTMASECSLEPFGAVIITVKLNGMSFIKMLIMHYLFTLGCLSPILYCMYRVCSNIIIVVF